MSSLLERGIKSVNGPLSGCVTLRLLRLPFFSTSSFQQLHHHIISHNIRHLYRPHLTRFQPLIVH